MQLLYSAQILSCELHDIRQCFVTIASYMLCKENGESLKIYDFHSTLTRHFKIFYEHAVRGRSRGITQQHYAVYRHVFEELHLNIYVCSLL